MTTNHNHQKESFNNAYDIEDITKTYRLYKVENYFVEARLLGTPSGIISGYFNDEQKFIAEMIKYSGKVKGVYITLNPIAELPSNITANILHQHAKTTTKDADIAFRKWLLIDVDPKRPANTSSTEEEFNAACDVAEQVKAFTDAQGWSEPVEACSGNGAHLLYPIDLPNDKASTELIKNVLKALHQKFSTEKADVDVTTYNASRISKVYGTMACKGENSKERPHSMAILSDFPTTLSPVPEEKLQKVSAMAKVEQSKSSNFKKQSTMHSTVKSEKSFNVEAFMQRHELAVHHVKEEEDSKIYVLERCPWNEEHTDTAAFIQQFSNGAIAAGCHHASCEGNDWHSLREMLEPKSASSDEKVEKAYEVLAEICLNLPLYTDELDEPYTIIQRKERTETVDVNSKDFKDYLTYCYFVETNKSVPRESLQRVVDTFKAKAKFEGVERHKYLRVAHVNKALYYNLANEKGEVVKVTRENISIAPTDEVFFRTTANEAKQVTPDLENGNIQKLFDHVRMNEENKLLYVVNVCTAFIPTIAHAILVLQGEKGAAKSTTMTMTRQLIDPAKQPKLQLAKQESDFRTTLYANYVASYDNVRGFSKDKSDTFCMTSTGGAIPLRKLYTTNDEVLLDIRRVVMLNGINFSVTEPDLVDRSLIIQLERIPEEERRTEDEVNRLFEKDKPMILGGILKVLQKAMHIYPTVKLDKLPRLADFAKWGYAIAEAIEEGNGKKFLQAYERNRLVFNDEVIQTHPVSAVVTTFMHSKKEWHGSMASLLSQLDMTATNQRIDVSDRRYPKSASFLSRRLKEVQSNLKDIGITFEIRNVGQHKEITLTNTAPLEEISKVLPKFTCSTVDNND